MKEKVLGQVVRDNTRRIENSIIFRSNPNCLKSKVVKEYISENFTTCKSLCNLQELYTAFKEKHPNVNIGLSKYCALRPKWCVLDGSKLTHSVCGLQHSSKYCVASRCSGLELDIQVPDQINFLLPLSISIRIYISSLLYHHHTQEYFLTEKSLVHLIQKCS